MKKLPFIVEPRLKPIKELVGSDESGKLEVERKGYLTAAEKAFVQAQSTTDDSTQRIVALCRQLATEMRIDMQEAYHILTSVMQGDLSVKRGEEVQAAHGDAIDDIVTAMTATNDRHYLVCALCMLTYRVDGDLDADDLLQLHPDIMEGLVELYTDEEARSTERLTQLVSEGDLKAGGAESIDALEKK